MKNKSKNPAKFSHEDFFAETGPKSKVAPNYIQPKIKPTIAENRNHGEWQDFEATLLGPKTKTTGVAFPWKKGKDKNQNKIK